MRQRRAVVVGAGLGGLAAAAHLVERDFDVVVVERDATPGGRAGRLELGAYTFDTGPTVITMPDILRRTFAAVDVELDKVVDLVALDPVYRATFVDGSALESDPASSQCAKKSARPSATAKPTRSFGSRTGSVRCTRSKCRTSSIATTTRRST